MTSLNKGISMNLHSQIRKDLGTVGNYFDIDPFQINLYDSFQSHQKKLIPETIQFLKPKKKQKKHKKITFPSKESKVSKKPVQRSNPLQSSPSLQDFPNLQHNSSLKTIHITNMIPEKDKGDIIL